MSQSKAIGKLGDSAQRNYVDKLISFNQFAEPELRRAIAALNLGKNSCILDAGSGAGLITQWLEEAVAPFGQVVGVDLAYEHAAYSLQNHPVITQANLAQLPFRRHTFDLIWCSNTINHLSNPRATIQYWMTLLKPGGRIVVGQATLLPDMIFAWDEQLERQVTHACRRYYGQKYGLSEQELGSLRNWVGLLRNAGLSAVHAATSVIERIAPLSPADEAYFAAWFRNYWGHRVQPYLSPQDWRRVEQLCDPQSDAFAPRRSDFHFIQTYTLVIGKV